MTITFAQVFASSTTVRAATSRFRPAIGSSRSSFGVSEEPVTRHCVCKSVTITPPASAASPIGKAIVRIVQIAPSMALEADRTSTDSPAPARAIALVTLAPNSRRAPGNAATKVPSAQTKATAEARSRLMAIWPFRLASRRRRGVGCSDLSDADEATLLRLHVPD